MIKIVWFIGISVLVFKLYSYIRAGSRADKFIKGELERPDLIQFKKNVGRK